MMRRLDMTKFSNLPFRTIYSYEQLDFFVFQRIIAELNKEQEAFIAGKQNEKGEAVAPWVGAPNEDALREECLALSTVSSCGHIDMKIVYNPSCRKSLVEKNPTINLFCLSSY